MSTYTHDIVATIGEYTTTNGEKRKRYLTCGKAFTDDQGRISLKLEAIPCAPEWSGWLSLYPADKERQRPAPESRQPDEKRRHEAAKAAAAERVDDAEDDIPF